MPPTWKNRPNGLRPDLAEALDALKLKYLQFPGGCTAESFSMDSCWNWKNSIGPLEERAGSTKYAEYELKPGAAWKSADDPVLLARADDWLKHGAQYTVHVDAAQPGEGLVAGP